MRNASADHVSAAASMLPKESARKRRLARLVSLLRRPEQFMVSLLFDARNFRDALVLYLTGIDRLAPSLCSAALNRTPAQPMSWNGVEVGCGVDVPAETFKDVSVRQDRSVLHTTVLIHGVHHHLKAFRVETGHSMLFAVDSASESELAQMHALYGACGPFQTVSLNGLEYVFILTPYSH